MSKERYTYARFWKCALQVNPAGYIKFRGTDHGLTEDQYNQALVRVARENDIKVIGLANHGSVDGVDSVRDLMTKNDIIVFPGFEIATTEKAHFVCLFPENTSKEQLNRYLGALGLTNPNDGVWPTDKGGNDLLAKVNELGGFAYAAHCTDDNGILRQKLAHVWKNPLLKAAQIPGALDELKNGDGHGFRQILLNQTPEYRRETSIAILNAKDVAVPDDLANPKASCLIKMTRPCFESFKLAFQDPESRVRLNSDVSEKYYSRIESLKVTGGYLDGLEINFSEHLNAVIGGRGTGKSTLIECIRYALGLRPVGKNAQRQHDEVIKANIGAAKARIEIVIRSSTMNGKRFTIARRYGENPVVRDEQDSISAFTPQDLLPGIEIFGQNEIYEIAQDVLGQRRLLERFLDVGEETIESRINEIIVKLKANRKQIVEAQEGVAAIEDDVARLPKLQEQVTQFRNLGLEEKLKIVPKLEAEKRLDARAREDMAALETAVATVAESLPDVTFLGETAIGQLPHADILRRIRAALERSKGDAEAGLKQLAAMVAQHSESLKALRAELAAAIKAEEETLEKTFKDLPASEGRSGKELGIQFQTLVREIERIRPKETLLSSKKAVLDELTKVRKALLDELSSSRVNRSSQFERALKKLNKRLEGKLRLTVTPEGDRSPLKRYLLTCELEGIAEGRLAWIDSADDFSVTKLAELIGEGVDALKSANWGITNTVAEGLARLTLSQRLEIAEIEFPDVIRIELNVAHEGAESYRELDRLSTGQQCTAILHLLLLSNLDPLIMDQPEDNLDNAFIADRIVSELRAAKIARQFLFATHNANIPVFGDAEWIGVFSASEGHSTLPVDYQGAIDVPQIRSLAADILEGGKTAFNQRKAKYGF